LKVLEVHLFIVVRVAGKRF